MTPVSFATLLFLSRYEWERRAKCGVRSTLVPPDRGDRAPAAFGFRARRRGIRSRSVIAIGPIVAGKWSVSAANLVFEQHHDSIEETNGMNAVPDRAQITSSFKATNPSATIEAEDPVSRGLRESARRMIGIAVFSGVIHLLMLSGSFYMFPVYLRLYPYTNVPR